METEKFILSIDQGTTGTTVLVFNHAGAIAGRAYAELTQYYPQPGWVEHDAEEIWQVTRRLVAEALANAGGLAASSLAALGITNQRETVVLWDRATGVAVTRAIVWQDRRTAPLCEALQTRGLSETFRHATGLVIDPYFSGTKIKWMLDQIEGLRARAVRGELACGTIDSWLIWKLSGGQAHITDVSNASRTLLFNIRELGWDEELLQTLDIPRALLPQVVSSSGICAQTDERVFFGARVPISGIAGDQHAALFGQACYRPGMAKNTYGTGSFLMMHTGTKIVPSHEGLLTTIAWRIGDEAVEYALEGSVFITGAAVQWLRDGLQIIESAAETEALARSVETNDGVYFVPALTGLGAPHWDAYARGVIVGLTRGTTRAHLVRATLESMCYQTRDVLQAMERDAGLPLVEIRADGGAVVNQFLMQFQADILGVAVEVPEINETTAAGAAYLAGLAVGFWKSREEIAARWQLAHRYEPRMHMEERERLSRRWLKAVARARDWAREDE